MEIDYDKLAEAIVRANNKQNTEPIKQEEISLTIHLDNEKFPQVKIQLYRNDGDTCLAVVDGESICLVNRSDVMDLVEEVQAIVLN